MSSVLSTDQVWIPSQYTKYGNQDSSSNYYTHPTLQECLALLQEAERILATALSLQLKLKQGVEFSGQEWEGERGAKKEVNTCIEVLLDSDELVIENPSSSHIGMGLRGLLIAHQDVEVSKHARTYTHIAWMQQAFIYHHSIPKHVL